MNVRNDTPRKRKSILNKSKGTGKKIKRKIGDNVMVYMNPFGEKDENNQEGKAILMEKIDSGIETDCWQVRFFDDNFVCKRRIPHDYK